MSGVGPLAVWDRLAASVPLLVFIAVVATIGVFRREIRTLLGMVTHVKYKDFSAEFDKVAKNAFAAAAEKVWKRPENQQEYDIDPDLYFSDADFTSAKQLESMMPIRRWMLIARLQVRRSIRTLVYDLADQFHKVRAESPGDGRTKRQSAVVARMRMLAFAGYPMIPELMRAHRVGGRIAAIAFLQVRPDYKTSALVWLGERVSSREQQLVQYHAAGALLVACRNAEERDLKTLCEVIEDTTDVCEKMDPKIRSERALELLAWCQSSLDRKPYAKADSITAILDVKPPRPM